MSMLSRPQTANAPMLLRLIFACSWRYLALIPLLMLLFGACSTEQVVGSTKTASSIGAAEVASPIFPMLPYLDIASFDTPPAHAAAALGMSGCILGFVVATTADDATPCWGQAGPADGKILAKEIAQLRERGLDLWLSFGGADHRNLACVASDPETLMQLYAGVVRAYAITGVDFDVEGEALKDKESVRRRAQAWRLWRDRGDMPPTILTVPVLPSGLTPEVLEMLLVHRDLGVLPDWLNLMVMNYGPANAPNPAGRMAEFAMSAASNTVAQLRSHGLTALLGGHAGFSRLGITPMVGCNAVAGEQFSLQDARRLRQWAEVAQPGFLSFWSLNRDRNNVELQDECPCRKSGVPQTELEFFRTLGTLP